jgi:hypothetical protein
MRQGKQVADKPVRPGDDGVRRIHFDREAPGFITRPDQLRHDSVYVSGGPTEARTVGPASIAGDAGEDSPGT